MIGTIPEGWPATTRRFAEQRWLVDLAIRSVGLDWDQGRSRYIALAGGPLAVAAFGAVRERVASLADFPREFEAAAASQEEGERAALQSGDVTAAAAHALAAALLWGAAEWPFFVSPASARRAFDAGERKVAAYRRWSPQADHEIRELEIEARGVSLPALLHLPAGGSGPAPAVLHVGGMDSFKEHAVAGHGDRWLARGIARLVVDFPGQGEAIRRAAWVDERGVLDHGRAAVGMLRQQPGIDPDRIGITGVSFGSYWATQLAAHVEGIAGTAIWGACHEPGMRSIFESASPTFKARFMAMAGMTDEARFDVFARSLDLRSIAGGIDRPFLAIAGEDDELSPLEHTIDLLRRVTGPAAVVVYRGERHSIGGAPSARLGPNHIDLAADWLAACFAGRPVASTFTTVEPDGSVRTGATPN